MKYLLIISVVCYSIGVVHAIVTLIRKKSSMFTAVLWTLALGFAVHTASLLVRGWEVGRCPLMLQQEVCSFLAWAVMAYYLCAYFWYRSQVLSSFVMPVVFIFSLAALIIPEHGQVPQMLRFGENTTLLVIHAALFIFAYGAFAITFLAGVMYIIQERELKLKRFGSIFFRLPSLDTCDDLGYKSLGLGFVLLTLGIVTGIIGSRNLDGLYWHGDPSEFLALATWGIYLFMVHCRLTAGWQGRRAAVLGIAGFVMTLLSLAGVGYLSGFHFGSSALYKEPVLLDSGPGGTRNARECIRYFEERINGPQSGKLSDKDRDSAYAWLADLYGRLDDKAQHKKWLEARAKLPGQKPAITAQCYYWISVIDWEAAHKISDKYAIPGMIPPKYKSVKEWDAKDKEEAAKNIQEGMKYNRQALAANPNYPNAYAYQNLLCREQIKLEHDPKIIGELVKLADEAVEKFQEVNRKAAEEQGG